MVIHHPMISDVIAIGALGVVSFGAAVISEATKVPLGGAISVGCSVAGFAWWMSGRFQKLDDSIESLQTRLDSLPCESRNPKAEKCVDKSK